MPRSNYISLTVMRHVRPFVWCVVVMVLGLSNLSLAQVRRLNSRRFSGSASDVLELERPTTADQVPPKITPSEIDQDRARSLALFGQARLLYQRGEAAKSLQTYQRAYHWNPDSAAPAGEIVPLAFLLRRPAEATRYALIAAENGKSDTQLTRQVALQLTQEDQYERAEKLYQRILKSLESPRSAEWVVTQFELGRLYFLTEQLDKAAESFAFVMDAIDDPQEFELDEQIIRELLGKPHLTYQLFGEAFLAADRVDRAERVFRRAEKAKSNKPLFAYQLARLAEKRNQDETALRELSKYLQSDCEDAGRGPYQLLQRLLPESNSETDNWRTRLEGRHAANPNASLTRFLAEYYEKNGNASRALILFQQLNVPASGEAVQGIFRTAMLSQDAAAMLDVLGMLVEQIASIEPLDLDDLRSRASGKQADDFVAKVLQTAKETLLPPKTQIAARQLFGAALLAIKAKEFDQADEFFAASVKSADDQEQSAWQFSAALEMFIADESERAAQQFQKLSVSGKSSDPSTIEFYWATALELANQTERAMEVIERSIARTPDSPLLCNRQAWIAYHAGQNDRAEQLYQAFLKKFADDYSSEGLRDLVKEAKMSLSNLALNRKDVNAAIEWLQQILDEYPEDAGAMNDLGYLLADENRHLQRALNMVRFAVASEPENQAYLDSLGWSLYRLEHYEEAAKYLQQAVGVDEPDGIILEHLGDVYHKMSQRQDAKLTWQRAVDALAKAKDMERAEIVKKKIAALDD